VFTPRDDCHTRDVPFQPRLIKTKARRRGPNILQRRKQEEIDRPRAEGIARIGELSANLLV